MLIQAINDRIIYTVKNGVIGVDPELRLLVSRLVSNNPAPGTAIFQSLNEFSVNDS